MFRIALAALALTAGSAGAQDLSLYGGGELEFAFDEDGPDTGTNSYLSAYLELESRGFYAGIWGQVADDALADEVDLYLGYRTTLASRIGYDIGYIRYLYPNDVGDYGELTLGLEAPAGDKLSLSLDLAYDPENKLGNAYVGAAFAASDKLELSANYGIYEVAEAPSETEWDIGATWALTDELGVDLRYYDGSEYLGSYIGVSLAWDTTLLGG
ncbi:TorF family putative porin [Tabrizicola sp.]|uniref:TorF family putative porin n=1 Tax=Tabrizicola sp. TaxID=2005166 RepID=UPI002FDCE7E3